MIQVKCSQALLLCFRKSSGPHSDGLPRKADVTKIDFYNATAITEGKKSKRPMGLDVVLDNTDKSSKHSVVYDKQMHQITPQITLNAIRSKTPHLCDGSKLKLVLLQGQLFSC